MNNTTLEIREKGNLRYRLILNEFSNDEYNYSVTEHIIVGNGLTGNNAELDKRVFDTLRKAKNYLNKQTPGWFIIPGSKLPFGKYNASMLRAFGYTEKDVKVK